VLAAVQSTEVADEREHRGLVAPQRAEHDQLAALILDRHLGEGIGAFEHAPLYQGIGWSRKNCMTCCPHTNEFGSWQGIAY